MCNVTQPSHLLPMYTEIVLKNKEHIMKPTRALVGADKKILTISSSHSHESRATTYAPVISSRIIIPNYSTTTDMKPLTPKKSTFPTTVPSPCGTPKEGLLCPRKACLKDSPPPKRLRSLWIQKLNTPNNT